MKLVVVICLLLLASLADAEWAGPLIDIKADAPDFAYVNGKVYTVDENNPNWDK